MSYLPKSFGFLCCFCKKGIIKNEIDPLDISIMRYVDVGKESSPLQIFYTHCACLKSKLHAYFKGYFVIFDPESDSDKDPALIAANRSCLIKKIIELKNIDQWKVIYYGLYINIIDNSFVMDYCFARIERNELVDQLVLDIAGLTRKEEIDSIPKMIEAKINNPEKVVSDENLFYNKIWSYLMLASEICAQKIIN